MVTGIEIAGLALATFPIVIGSLEFYVNRARAIKELRRYTVALERLHRDLDTEQCKFENTCTLLLEGIVSDLDLTLLMEIPGGSLWEDEHIQEKLENRLRPGTVQCYMKCIEALRSTLETLQVELRLYEDKPESADRKALKKQLKKIRLFVSRVEYKELLTYMIKINADLATLTGQRKSDNPLPLLTAPAKHYKRIRNHAINLYGVLKEKLQTAPACECTVPHHANLRLEVRSRDTSLRFHVGLSSWSDPVEQGPLPQNWREMGIEPLESDGEPLESKQAKEVDKPGDPDDKGSHTDMLPCPMTTVSGPATNFTGRVKSIFGKGESSNTARSITPPGKAPPNLISRHPERQHRPTKTLRVSFSTHASYIGLAPIKPDAIPGNTTKQIENLCLTIQQAKSELSCLGVLIDEGSRRYRVWPSKTPSPAAEPANALSLESLLARPGALKMRDRLILGVQLAEAVMQLHTTEWLSENWGKRDILFQKETTEDAININHVIRKPFIHRVFASPGPSPQIIQEPTKPTLVPHDQSLFSLGVILVELCYGRCLENLRIEADRSGFGGVTGMTDMIDYATAKRLSTEIYEDAGEKYGAAVRRCIIGLDHKYSNLGADDFKDEVHKKVVSPLVENLESFCGMRLEEILQKENIGACI